MIQPEILAKPVSVDEGVSEAPPHVDEPRRRESHDDPQTRDPVKPQHRAPDAWRDDYGNQESETGEHQRQRTLRQHRRGEQRIPCPLPSWLILQRRGHNECRARKEKKREGHVENGVPRQRQRGRKHREQQGSRTAGCPVEERLPEPRRHRQQSQSREGRHKARREFGGAQQCEGCHLQQVEQDRLLEVRRAVVLRNEPVTGGEHLARRLRVMGLVRIPETGIAETPEDDDPADERPANGGQNAFVPPQGNSVRRTSPRRRKRVRQSHFKATATGCCATRDT